MSRRRVWPVQPGTGSCFDRAPRSSTSASIRKRDGNAVGAAFCTPTHVSGRARGLDQICEHGKMRRQMPELERVEPLDDPPIVEVACGCIFSELDRLDPVVVGVYWNERRRDYPRHDLQPAITDRPVVAMAGQVTLTLRQGVPPVRTWFISEDDEFLVQIQSDRFYVNWRKRAGHYPRFTPEPGGVGVRTLEEFARFRDFCMREIGQEPVPLQAQLTKVDHIVQHQHWETFAELARMVPWLTDFSRFSHSGTPSINVRFTEPRDEGHVSVALDMLPAEAVQPAARGHVLKIEATATKTTAADRAAFALALKRANAEVNDVFAKLVPKPTRDAHFQGQREA